MLCTSKRLLFISYISEPTITMQNEMSLNNVERESESVRLKVVNTIYSLNKRNKKTQLKKFQAQK